jgi:hypothetical protein
MFSLPFLSGMQPSLVIHIFFPALSSWAKFLRFVPLPVKYALPMEDVVHFLKARMLQLGSFCSSNIAAGGWKL